MIVSILEVETGPNWIVLYVRLCAGDQNSVWSLLHICREHQECNQIISRFFDCAYNDITTIKIVSVSNVRENRIHNVLIIEGLSSEFYHLTMHS